MSWRLYFRTGVCPVWKAWLLAQPRLTRIICNVETRNSKRSAGSCHLHQRQNGTAREAVPPKNHRSERRRRVSLFEALLDFFEFAIC
jgi:hypothetical protein